LLSKYDPEKVLSVMCDVLAGYLSLVALVVVFAWFNPILYQSLYAVEPISDTFNTVLGAVCVGSTFFIDVLSYKMTRNAFRLSVPTALRKPGVKANVIFFDKKPASPEMQTKDIWIYDFRTNIHFTLKQHPMTDADLLDFIQCYHPENRHERTETWSEENPDGRWRKFSVEEILKRDKTSLDIFWIKDKSLADLDSLPDPDVLAADIIENLQSAMDSFNELMSALKK